MDWQDFVMRHGCYVPNAYLAVIVGRSADEIDRFRAKHPSAKSKARPYAELFARFRGRAPRDHEWPVPVRAGSGGYHWLPNELAFLATLVGRMATPEISRVMTARLRRLTGDRRARRDGHAVQTMINRIGLTANDVVGGITLTTAAREVGVRTPLWNDIRSGKLRAFRVGRLHVIPHAAFEAWKAKRVFPPAGYVRLRVIKGPLGIKSDKLSEFARAGHLAGAVRCNPFGTKGPSTQFGTWWIDRKLARKLIADRRAGRPMPWHGEPCPSNLGVTWRLWRKRKHPARCQTCQDIWGNAGAPTTFDDYRTRYPRLDLGAKKHLTRAFSDGLTVRQVATYADVTEWRVVLAIRNGSLRVAHRVGGRRFISRTDATGWKARKCPSGTSTKSMIAVATAATYYGFTVRELEGHIRAGRLLVRIGINGPQRGVRYLAKQQVRSLRARLGYTVPDAARRCRVSVARLKVLLRGLEWRPAPRIPLEVINSVLKRKYSSSGLTLAEAARTLKKPVGWVRQQMHAGTFRVLRTKWNARRRYVSMPMLRRLKAAAHAPCQNTAVAQRRMDLDERGRRCCWRLAVDGHPLV